MDDLLVKPAVKSVVSADSAVYNKSVLARRSSSPAAQTVTPMAGQLDAKSKQVMFSIAEYCSIFFDQVTHQLCIFPLNLFLSLLCGCLNNLTLNLIYWIISGGGGGVTMLRGAVQCPAGPAGVLIRSPILWLGWTATTHSPLDGNLFYVGLCYLRYKCRFKALCPA